MRTARFPDSWTEIPPGQRPHRQRPPGQRHPLPLHREPPWTETASGQRSPWTETPSGQRPLDRDPWTETPPEGTWDQGQIPA